MGDRRPMPCPIIGPVAFQRMVAGAISSYCHHESRQCKHTSEAVGVYRKLNKEPRRQGGSRMGDTDSCAKGLMGYEEGQ